MPNITAVITDDARTYWPAFFGYSSTTVPATGVIESPTVFTSPTSPLSGLAYGDLFVFTGNVYRKVDIPTAAACLTGGNVWYESVFNGVVHQTPGTTVVTRLRNWNLIPSITSFKIGEGGWIDLGAGKQPRVPDPSLRLITAPPNNLQDLDSIIDGTRAPIDQRYPSDVVNFSWAFYEKQITAADIIAETPFTARVRCFLDFGEFNDDGFGHSPELWEIGLFTDHPTVLGQKLMVAYGTFPLQTKNNATQIENFVRVAF
jgi:hypothetical protein